MTLWDFIRKYFIERPKGTERNITTSKLYVLNREISSKKVFGVMCLFVWIYGNIFWWISEVHNWANKNTFNESWPGTFIHNSILCVKLFIKSSVNHKKIFIILEKGEIEISLELNSTIFNGYTRCKYVPSKLDRLYNLREI